MEPKRKSGLDKMKHSRGTLNDVLRKASPLNELYPDWKLKQVLDHITAWDELVLATLHAFAGGEIPARMAEKGLNQFNAMAVARRKELTLEQSWQAYDAARVHLLEALRDLAPDKLDEEFPAPWGGMCTINSISRIIISHELEHAKHIKALLKG